MASRGAATALVGAALFALSTSPGLAQTPQLVDVGGHRLEAVAQGEGQPIVVIEAGLGQDWRHWAPVLDSVSSFSRGIAYARAGYAGSEPSPQERSPLQIVAELRAMLSSMGAAGPYILVGHSFGGLTMQVFASQHPEEVAGLLLVDSTHIRQAVEFNMLEEFEDQLNDMLENTPGPITDEAAAMWVPSAGL